jgi:hypothetical protein
LKNIFSSENSNNTKWQFNPDNKYSLRIKNNETKVDSKPIIIAIIDNGVNFNESDIRTTQFINEGEIPNNFLTSIKKLHFVDF